MGWDGMLSKEVRALFSKEQYIFYPNRSKTPSFSYGDIRHVHQRGFAMGGWKYFEG